MGFRFRKSLKIAPGVRWNVGLRGSSISVGRRGASLNFSKRGTRATVGIPGSGLSYTTSVGTSRRRNRTESPGAERSPSADALGVPALTPRRSVAIFSLILLWFWPAVAVGGFMVALAFPSRSTLARRELERRTGLLKVAAATLKEDSSVEDVDHVIALAKQIPGDAPAVRRIADTLVAMRTLIPLERGGALTQVVGAGDILGSDRCFLTAEVFLDKHGDDEDGKVYFGETKILFIGQSRVEIPWTKVQSTTHNGEVVTVQRTDRKTPFNFSFEDVETATRAGWIATKLRESTAESG